MTHSVSLDETHAVPAAIDATIEPGLPDAIDAVAQAAAETHRFLRRQWYAAALHAYGGTARTIVARIGDMPVAALPIVAASRVPGMATVPGCYWPFRGFPVATIAGDAVFDTLLDAARREARVLRIGPVHDGDPAVARVVARARATGWGVVQRRVASSFVLDMAAAARGESGWPRSSTLRKNRFHEKHLADHGALDWSFAAADQWPAVFDAVASVEERSWLAERTDGRDAKFTHAGHGAFFRTAAQDPVIAGMFHAALLSVDGVPAAFSFDLDAGALKYAIANSYDPRFAKHSPGKLLYYRNLVEAIGRGITRVDWGAGDSGYKRVIGAEEGPAMRDWLLLRPGMTAMLAPVVQRMFRDQG